MKSFVCNDRSLSLMSGFKSQILLYNESASHSGLELNGLTSTSRQDLVYLSQYLHDEATKMDDEGPPQQ